MTPHLSPPKSDEPQSDFGGGAEGGGGSNQ